MEGYNVFPEDMIKIILKKEGKFWVVYWLSSYFNKQKNKNKKTQAI